MIDKKGCRELGSELKLSNNRICKLSGSACFCYSADYSITGEQCPHAPLPLLKRTKVEDEIAADLGRAMGINDPINHPTHYTSHPSGVEVIQITEHENFCIGNAIKYLMRHNLKGAPVQDLKKAIFYIDREIQRLEKLNKSCKTNQLLKSIKPDK